VPQDDPRQLSNSVKSWRFSVKVHNLPGQNHKLMVNFSRDWLLSMGRFVLVFCFERWADLERQWAEARYKLPFHSSTFEFHGFYASIRDHLEKEWNVGW
jgi:hypothetical protein